MLKSNKLIIFLISLPFLMVIVFYSLSEHPGYSGRGEYDNGGDVSGNYHIYFTAYVDHNRERTISVELFFPDASIPPFTLFPPNPYTDKGKKMSNWLMGNIEVSEETSK